MLIGIKIAHLNWNLLQSTMFRLIHFGRVSTFLYLLCCTWACQSQEHRQFNFMELKAKLEASPSTQTYNAFHFLLSEHYTDLSADQRKVLRASLEKYAQGSSAVLCSGREPGVKLHLEGTLADKNGQAIPGAHLHIFHTDHQGFYSPLDSITGRMLEQDPRLEGFLDTDQKGHFSIQTVRPGNYPKKYEGRLLPQHIHIVASARGFATLSVQVAFYDDPAMDDYWLNWAKEAEFPLVRLEKTAAGMSGKFQLLMVKK